MARGGNAAGGSATMTRGGVRKTKFAPIIRESSTSLSPPAEDGPSEGPSQGGNMMSGSNSSHSTSSTRPRGKSRMDNGGTSTTWNRPTRDAIISGVSVSGPFSQGPAPSAAGTTGRSHGRDGSGMAMGSRSDGRGTETKGLQSSTAASLLLSGHCASSEDEDGLALDPEAQTNTKDTGYFYCQFPSTVWETLTTSQDGLTMATEVPVSSALDATSMDEATSPPTLGRTPRLVRLGRWQRLASGKQRLLLDVSSRTLSGTLDALAFQQLAIEPACPLDCYQEFCQISPSNEAPCGVSKAFFVHTNTRYIISPTLFPAQ